MTKAAYLNGEYLELAELTISPWDFGFTMGATVAEFVRTFNGKPVLLDRHLNRLSAGLDAFGIDGVDVAQVRNVVNQLVEDNIGSLPDTSELAIHICITPGHTRRSVPSELKLGDGPTVMVYVRELCPSHWQEIYEHGVRLQTVPTWEVNENSIPKSFKCRSRAHYYLADREAEQQEPGSRALMQNEFGDLLEGTTASFALVSGRSFVVPPAASVLHSISLDITVELARASGLEVERRSIIPADMDSASEAFWMSASFCLAPVASFNGRSLPAERPRFTELLSAWNDFVGVDLRAQSRSSNMT